MSRRPRRNHSALIKAKAAFAAIKGERTHVMASLAFGLANRRSPSLDRPPHNDEACVVAARARSGARNSGRCRESGSMVRDKNLPNASMSSGGLKKYP